MTVMPRSRKKSEPKSKCARCGAAIEQPRTGRPKSWCSDACKKAGHRAARAKKAGHIPRQGRYGRVAKRSLVDILAPDLGWGGMTLNPAPQSAGTWVRKTTSGMRTGLARAFGRKPMPCRLIGTKRAAFACVVIRMSPERATRKQRAAERRALVRSIVERLDREYPDLRRVIAAVPKAIEQTERHDCQRRGAPGVAVLVFFGRDRPRSTESAVRLEQEIATRCGWSVERSDEVPFTDDWRLLDEQGANVHVARRGAGKGTRRRMDLAWLAREIGNLWNPVSAFRGGSFVPSICTDSTPRFSEDLEGDPLRACADRRDETRSILDEKVEKTRVSDRFSVGGAAA